MNKGYITVYYGEGKGKTTSAIGQGLKAIGDGLQVIMVRFMDGNKKSELLPLQKFEPELKVFRFERVRGDGEESTRQEQQLELSTAFQFSKKLLETGECDVLILDGILDAISKGFVKDTELCQLMERRPEYLDVLITGTEVSQLVQDTADYVYHICTVKAPMEE